MCARLVKLSIVLAQDHFYSVLILICNVHMLFAPSMMMSALQRIKMWSSLYMGVRCNEASHAAEAEWMVQVAAAVHSARKADSGHCHR